VFDFGHHIGRSAGLPCLERLHFFALRALLAQLRTHAATKPVDGSSAASRRASAAAAGAAHCQRASSAAIVVAAPWRCCRGTALLAATLLATAVLAPRGAAGVSSWRGTASVTAWFAHTSRSVPARREAEQQGAGLLAASTAHAADRVAAAAAVGSAANGLTSPSRMRGLRIGRLEPRQRHERQQGLLLLGPSTIAEALQGGPLAAPRQHAACGRREGAGWPRVGSRGGSHRPGRP
jgi:hypothetical protein